MFSECARHAVSPEQLWELVPGAPWMAFSLGRVILTVTGSYDANEPCVFRCFKTVQFKKCAFVFFFLLFLAFELVFDLRVHMHLS